MKTKPKAFTNIDEYIAGFPKDVRKILESIRRTIRKAAPASEETISYQMPAFKLKGALVYFAAYKNHIGLYPTASAVAKFKRELSGYEGSRGTVRFPLDKPIPLGLITKIAKFKAKENLAKAKSVKK
jgi:uncharacterized protein YdhG (YjbR/CyaY superfamily)